MRNPEFSVAQQFVERWSPRAYDPAQSLKEGELQSLFEAARWAPSSSNEQPWKFYYPKDENRRAEFNAFVNDNNRSWAQYAPLLIVVCARKNFAVSGLPNPHAWYDTGAAVLSLILQAKKMGYAARQMAGIMKEVIAEKIGIDTTREDIISAVALGHPTEPSRLAERHVPLEQPNGRKSISEFAVAV